MNRIFFLFFFGLVGLFEGLQEPPYPLVILPTAIRWNGENSITVVPRDWSSGFLTISVGVFSKDPATSKENLFHESRVVSENEKTQNFVFHTSQKSDSFDYEIQINVTGHKSYSTVLFGGPDLNFISVQTDKGYYSPGEEVNMRILPVTDSGDLFRFPLKVSLVNAQGFKVVTDTRYTLPKFLVSMHVRDSENSVDHTTVEIHARHPNGAPVTGSVALSCKDGSQPMAFRQKGDMK
ncbi:hypothetical protein FO519_003739 [Halicephalobus sp. NKZ332]|nr:hypothetical protein FO519_003739 [Halicephalobus sp. NKZ332]